MTSEFNAIDHAAELESAGVPKEQAAVHASALSKILAGCAMGCELEALRTELRSQLAAFRAEFEAFKIEISSRLTTMEASLRTEIKMLETSLRADINIVRSEVKLLRWIVGISVGLQIAVLLKLIYP